MKDVTKDLASYLSTVKSLTSCDLYDLVLDSGNTYRYCDTDQDITYNGSIYRYNALLLSRQQIKTNPSISVDSMTVTVYCDKNDSLESKAFLRAAHDGTLDQAKLYLSRCFFNGQTVVGAIALFGGRVEVKQAGGIKVELTVKSKTQGLNMQFPLRKYYPQGTYTLNSDSNIISSQSSEETCLIAPFVPQKEVLL